MNADTGRIYSDAFNIDAAINRGERLIVINKPKNATTPTVADFRAVEKAEAKRNRKLAARLSANAKPKAF